MLRSIGSITNNCCSILKSVRKKISSDDLEDGVLTVVGLRMANRNNTTKQKEAHNSDHSHSLDVTDTDNADNDIIESPDNISHFQTAHLTRSMESLYQFAVRHLQTSSSATTVRRFSHNTDRERRRSLMWIRPTTEEIMARVNSRTPEERKSMQIDLVGVTAINNIFQRLAYPIK
ncbi:2-oxoglutarate dehydrogenase E1 component [Dirofilaria immitis]